MLSVLNQKSKRKLRRSVDGRAAEFLQKLAELCVEYNMSVGGCGCCESMWVVEEESGRTLVRGLNIIPNNRKMTFGVPSDASTRKFVEIEIDGSKTE